MLSTPVSEQIPIWHDDDGRLRVSKTRVLLDLVIGYHQRGKTPEAIVQSFPTLSLADVYLIIGYYLRNPSEIDAYLQQQEAEAEAFRRRYEAEHPPTLTREVLLARLEAKRNRQDV